MNIKIVYFSSPGCSICSQQSYILQEIQNELDIEIEQHLITTAFDKALSFGIKSAPALVFLKNGKAQLIKTGFQPKEVIREIVDQIS